MNSSDHFLRVCREIHQKNLVVATGGNVSMRIEDKVYITPSGYPLGFLGWDDIVEVDLNGKVTGKGIPSKEVFFHLGLYLLFPEIGAVVHIHSFYANCVGAQYRDSSKPVMPAYTANYVKLVGELPVVPFCRPGSVELSNSICKAMSDSQAKSAILQNHGIVSVGKEILEAFYRAEIIEENAHFHLILDGKGRSLSEEEVTQLL